MTLPLKSIGFLLFVVGSTAACASAPKPVVEEVRPPAPAPTAQGPTAAQLRERDEQQKAAEKQATFVVIDPSILAACGIDKSYAHFAFDSSRLETRYDAGLEAVAKCFTVGPLAGRRMRLLGFTDARGDEAYNQALGERRAVSVKTFISSKGFQAEMIGTNSMGEMQAAQTAECEGDRDACEVAWGADRHVDVQLGD